MKKDRFAHYKVMPTDYEQKIKLSEMKNLGAIIAKAVIKEYGFYTCLLDGKKTLVVE